MSDTERLRVSLYRDECPHAQFADDDPYLRANGCKQIACGRCVAEAFEKSRRGALEEAAQLVEWHAKDHRKYEYIAADIRRLKEER